MKRLLVLGVLMALLGAGSAQASALSQHEAESAVRSYLTANAESEGVRIGEIRYCHRRTASHIACGIVEYEQMWEGLPTTVTSGLSVVKRRRGVCLSSSLYGATGPGLGCSSSEPATP